jgi:hypothetical protein
MKKQSLAQWPRSVILGLLLIVSSPVVMAADPPPTDNLVGGGSIADVVIAIQQGTNTLVAAIKNSYSEYVNFLNTLLFQDNPYVASAMAFNTNIAKTDNVLQSQVYAPSTQLLPFTYNQAAYYSSGNQRYHQTGNIQDIYLNLATMTNPNIYYNVFGQLCAGDFNYTMGNTGSFQAVEMSEHGPNFCKSVEDETKDVQNVDIFNASSLLSHDTYSPEINEAAKNFIGYLAYSNPYLVLSTQTWNALASKDQMNNGSVNEYRAAVRQYIAYKSMGLDNLYYLYSQHIPQNDLLDDENKPVSRNTYLHTIATRRTNDPDWYNFISTEAKPSTVLRSIAIQLAEIEAQLDRDNNLRERELSIAAASEILLSEALQANLQQKQKAALGVQDTLQNASTDEAGDLSGGDDFP